MNSELPQRQKNGVELIAAERQRQISEECWMPEHDDLHTCGELAIAGACYALTVQCRVEGRAISRFWPFENRGFKPTKSNRIKELQKAGALIAAEIDRLQRAKLLSENAVSSSASSNPKASLSTPTGEER